MLNAEDEKKVLAALQVQRIIVFALSMGVLMFGFVVLLQKSLPPVGVQLAPWPLSPIAIFVAVSAIGMSFIVPQLLRQAKERAAEASSTKFSPWQIAQQMQVEKIVGCALLEGAAFLNLVAVMMQPSMVNLGVAAFLWLLIVSRVPFSADQFLAEIQARLRDQAQQ